MGVACKCAAEPSLLKEADRENRQEKAPKEPKKVLPPRC